MPKCTGRVVWVIPSSKAYVLSNNPRYGMKPGAYACESHAIARGYHLRPLNIVRPRSKSDEADVRGAGRAMTLATARRRLASGREP